MAQKTTKPKPEVTEPDKWLQRIDWAKQVKKAWYWHNCRVWEDLIIFNPNC